MANIANLSVSVSARIGKFTKAFAKMRKRVNRFASDINNAIGRITAIGGALTAIVAGAGFGRLVSEQFRVVDSTTKMADRLGVTTEALSAFQLVGERTGVTQRNLQLGFQRMARRISEAAQGTGEAQGVLKEFGLDAQELVRLSPDQQILKLADSFKQVGNQNERVRKAFKLFDSEGVGFVNFLKLGSEGIKEILDEAGELGATFNRIDAAKIEQANDAFGNVRVVIGNIAREFAFRLAPFLEGISNRFTQLAKDSDGFGRFVTNAIDNALIAFDKLLNFINLFRGSFSLFRATIEALGGGFVNFFRLVAEGFDRVFTFDRLRDRLRNFLVLIQTSVRGIQGFFGFEPEGFESLGNAINELSVNTGKSFAGKVADELQIVTDQFFDAARDSGAKSLQQLSSFVTGDNLGRVRAFYNKVSQEAEETAKKTNRALALDGDVDFGGDESKSSQFKQIDLSRIAVGGLQTGSNTQQVKDPQLQTTNSLLEQISGKIGNTAAVVS